ncbi:MAG TPA: maleylpyruvate isomerase family mycothiol-dependent enzyme [Streptosporangiaceae bacterium]|nr:maleylpyruvate isomerase family mycothiol-dependent enzyme [Streptosporangiaceae bacterium]
MPTLPAALLYAELEASSAALAALVDSADPGLPIPSCPGWTLRQLTTHVGRAHRWAAEIVRTRSAEFIEFRSVPDGRLPDDPAESGRWLTAGATWLIDALKDAGEQGVWTPAGMSPAGFWGRRMAHETIVHCADAQLAIGDEPEIPAELAADAIDEWLTVMSGPIFGGPDPRAAALPHGRALHVHVADPDLSGAKAWRVVHTDAGVQVQVPEGSGDVALAGPSADVLLVLLGRMPATAEAVRVFGDSDVLEAWLKGTSF